MKKIIALSLTVIIIFSSFSVLSSAKDNYKKFNIDNPYKDVDFEEWKAYKTQLHCHTTASDGYLKVADALEYYYNMDYDAIAFTDHGTNNQGWNIEPDKVPIMRAIKSERTGGAYASIDPISLEEYKAYLNGTKETYTVDELKSPKLNSATGVNYSQQAFGYADETDESLKLLKKATENGKFKRTNNSGMTDILLGNELNMATPVCDCHLTHYWCEYGEGLAGVYGDYETPASKSSEEGGVSMLSHVGEYVYQDKDTINHTNHRVDDYYVNKFAKIFLDNPVNGNKKGFVAGMGINSATDAHTRCDRFLYDQILQKTIPNGVTPWGFTFSDSHNFYSMNDAYTMMLIPDWSGYGNAVRNSMMRECMEKGEFFSVSHYSNGYEMDGEKEWPGSPVTSDNGDGKDWPDNKILLMNDTPMVTNLFVDDDTDTITVYAENADRIVWISDGNVIKRTENVVADKNGISKFKICLHEDGLKNNVNLFLRFYVTGEQGICYSQPFILHELDESGNEIPFEKVNVPETHDLSTFLRGLVTVLDWAIFKWNPIIWIFKYFALGYNPVSRFFTDIANIF